MSTTLEEFWDEVSYAYPQHSESSILDSFSSPFDSLDSEEDELEYSSSDLIKRNITDMNGPVLVEDLKEALSKVVPAQVPESSYPSMRAQQDHIASAIQSAFHEALTQYSIIDPNSDSTNKKRSLSSRRKRNNKVLNSPSLAEECHNIFSSEITHFWDGWFDDIEKNEEISYLEEEISTIEEELARIQEHKRYLMNGSPISSPISPSTPVLQDEQVYVIPVPAGILPTEQQETLAKFVQTEESCPDSPISIDADTFDSTIDSKEVLQVIISPDPEHTKKRSLRQPSVKTKKRKSDTDPSKESKKQNSSKSKKKLNFKNSAIKQAFKVEQVLKIKSVDKSSEDEDVDIGDLTDCINT